SRTSTSSISYPSRTTPTRNETEMTETLSHYINGATVEGTSTRTSPVFNPATGAVAKNVRLASTADVGTAVAAAHAAFPGWRDTSQAKRQTIMYRFRELINER